MSTCWVDTETYSPVPLRNGTGAYTANCEVMLVSWCLDDGDARVWDVAREPMPTELHDILSDPSILLVAHNAQFDRAALNAQPWFRAYAVPLERWRCTMAQAYAHGLPGALQALGEILGIREDHRKLKEGRDLVNLFCKPRPKGSKIQRATQDTHPVEWARFVEYSRTDALALRDVARLLPTWNYPDNPRELALWFLDQRINDRGVCVDLELAHAAVRATARAKRTLNQRTADGTDGYVERATQRDKLLVYLLAEYGVELPDLRADTIERRLNDPELPDAVKELLRDRLESSMTSQTKYETAISAASGDGRVRFLLQFCGAGRTGRWAGRILQPQNFPRPTWKQHDIDLFIRAVKAGVEDVL